MPNDRHLLRFYAVLTFLNDPALQSKDHVGGTLKISRFLAPTHAAFAMLEADKLLFHCSTTVDTFSFGCSSFRFVHANSTSHS